MVCHLWMRRCNTEWYLDLWFCLLCQMGTHQNIQTKKEGTKKQWKFNILFINDVTKWYTEMQYIYTCTHMYSIDIYMNRPICLHFTHPYKIFTLTQKLYEVFIYNEEKNGSHIFYKLICVEMSSLLFRLIDYAFCYTFFFFFFF